MWRNLGRERPGETLTGRSSLDIPASSEGLWLGRTEPSINEDSDGQRQTALGEVG